jgi:hypothetical protein
VSLAHEITSSYLTGGAGEYLNSAHPELGRINFPQLLGYREKAEKFLTLIFA